MRSRVMPGSFVTIERRVPVRRLNKVDLPTLGRPTMTMDGSFSLIFWGYGRACKARSFRGCGPAFLRNCQDTLAGPELSADSCSNLCADLDAADATKSIGSCARERR